MSDYAYVIEHWTKQASTKSGFGWTTEPPTVEGWYWARHEVTKEIVMTQVCQITSDYWTTENGPIWQFTHWLGPLPVPEPPTE